MKMRKWFHKWFAAIVFIFCLFIILYYLLIRQFYLQSQELKAPVTVNQARILTSEPLQMLTEALADHELSDGESQSLSRLFHDSLIIMTFYDLNGHIRYSSDESSVREIDLRYDLHYEISDEKTSGRYQIAFPVLDYKKTQIGNALFSIPKKQLLDQNSTPFFWLTIAPFLLLLLFIFLLWVHNRKIRMGYDKPLSYMKNGMERVLMDEFPTTEELSEKAVIPVDPAQLQLIFQQMYLHIEHLDLLNKQSETAQKELISNISHDIKTPLTTLNAYVDAILAGVCPDLPSVMRYVNVIHVHSEKMVHLVDDLFYHSLQQLGQISVTLTDRYSKDVFDRILPALKQMVSASHILWIEPTDLPNVLVRVDIGRIEQVMANLVQNAIKHTPEEGSIQIDFTIENNRFKTSVIDNGDGISPEDIPYVFDRYYQGHYKNDQKNDGAGLGLSICKYIIEHHDGEIYFKTIKGEGTSFYFSLPMI